jgi:hypothetical protein
VSLFQSNLRKQIRNLPKILNFVKKIHYYSKLFTSLLTRERGAGRAPLTPTPRALSPFFFSSSQGKLFSRIACTGRPLDQYAAPGMIISMENFRDDLNTFEHIFVSTLQWLTYFLKVLVSHFVSGVSIFLEVTFFLFRACGC